MRCPHPVFIRILTAGSQNNASISFPMFYANATGTRILNPRWIDTECGEGKTGAVAGNRAEYGRRHRVIKVAGN